MTSDARASWQVPRGPAWRMEDKDRKRSGGAFREQRL